MKKISTVAVKQNRNFREQKLTIGLDLGVPRLRRFLTPKISRRRQPTEALMMMTAEECHPEEMQAFATRRPADEGPTHYSPRGLAQTVASFYSGGCPVQARLGGLSLG